MVPPSDFKAKRSTLLREIEAGLHRLLPRAEQAPGRLHTAMRYSIEAGGKRLRPVLTLAAADLWGRRPAALAAAAAIECIHTYSLIHDDLPAMDNDDLRRGRPTCHRQFDEATAILAGDALLTRAFAILAEAYGATPELAVRLLAEISRAAGSEFLIGGQMDDILAERQAQITAEALARIHRRKTGAMIEVSLVAGGLCAGANANDIAGLREAGEHLGLAFQIIDDILDATATSAALGKTAGKDARADKSTYVKLHGLAASRARARECSEAAIAAFRRLPGDTDFLVQLTESMLERSG